MADDALFDVTLDLEDGAPVGGEAEQAQLVAELVMSPANRFGRVGVRIHPLHHACFRPDLETLIGRAGERLAYVMPSSALPPLPWKPPPPPWERPAPPRDRPPPPPSSAFRVRGPVRRSGARPLTSLRRDDERARRIRRRPPFATRVQRAHFATACLPDPSAARRGPAGLDVRRAGSRGGPLACKSP